MSERVEVQSELPLSVSAVFEEWRVSSHIVRYTTLTFQLFKNSTDTQGKLRLNLHSLSLSELLEYRRLFLECAQTRKHCLSEMRKPGNIVSRRCKNYIWWEKMFLNLLGNSFISWEANVSATEMYKKTFEEIRMFPQTMNVSSTFNDKAFSALTCQIF